MFFAIAVHIALVTIIKRIDLFNSGGQLRKRVPLYKIGPFLQPECRKNGPLPPETGRARREKGQRRFSHL